MVRGLADAVLVTGQGTGHGVDLVKLRRVKEALASKSSPVPVLVASGATIDSLPSLAGLCDGVIVGSTLRAGGVAGGAIDAARAEQFAAAFRCVR